MRPGTFRHAVCRLLFVVGLGAPGAASASESFTLFESGQARPLAMSPDRTRLFAVNTPDNRLEIFRITKRGLRYEGSVPVGLEPVAVTARTNTEVWVVNHLSDSVSIVDVANPEFRRVVRTLLVGDEPRDIVFAGARHDRAFITTAHRGQNTGRDPQLTTPGIGRADVWVFDATHLGSGLGGAPLTVITLFTDTPRALAATPDGTRVYAAGFLTGNRTTTINEFEVKTAWFRSQPGPRTNYAGIPQPDTGLIVKFDGRHWRDELGQVWDDKVFFSLPDEDVFAIDAVADPPVPLPSPNGYYSGVGTVIFNMVVNPASGLVYVANTEAFNQFRFEGAGHFAGHTVQGHLHESHITVLNGSPRVAPRHLNKHIDYSHCCDPIPNSENALSLAFPMGMAISSDGDTLYVAAFGSSKVGVFRTDEIEADTFQPDLANQIPVSGGGPTGVVLDEARHRLYVLTRFDDAISIVDTARKAEVGHVPLHNPEPAHIIAGRRFLFDASFSSSHGDSACGSCHVFGDFDGLAWDLGDPDKDEIVNNGPLLVPPEVGYFLLRGAAENPNFRPMKGPMTTQSLRGLDNHGSMHWRGDRTGGTDEPSVQPDGGSFSEQIAFRKFNVAFVGLNGRSEEIPAADMQAFTDFVLEITYPPNPIRNLDNSLTPQQQMARDFFSNGQRVDTFFDCNGCHVLNRDGNAELGVAHPGFFGSDGRFSFEGQSQYFKVPHLRNMYQKVGMFGMPLPPLSLSVPLGSLLFLPLANILPQGDQVRGFGFTHDGSVDTLFRFVSNLLFLPRAPGTIPSLDPRAPPDLVPDPGNVGIPLSLDGLQLRRALEAFMLAFDSNLAPIVGQQVTLGGWNGTTVGPRIDLLIARADAGECDLVAKGRVGLREGGYLYAGGGMFISDLSREPALRDAELRVSAPRRYGEITYTCVPPGSGMRIGIDQDGDGFLDGDELAAGSDPADPSSTP